MGLYTVDVDLNLPCLEIGVLMVFFWPKRRNGGRIY